MSAPLFSEYPNIRRCERCSQFTRSSKHKAEEFPFPTVLRYFTDICSACDIAERRTGKPVNATPIRSQEITEAKHQFNLQTYSRWLQERQRRQGIGVRR